MSPGRGCGVVRLVSWALGASFLVLAAWIEVTGSFPGDARALDWMYRTLGTTFDRPMVVLGDATDLLPLVTIAAASVVLLLQMGRRVDAARLAMVFGVVLVVNRLLKELIARPRPDLRAVPESLSTYAFPSGHAANTAALVGAFFIVARTRAARTTIAVVGGAIVVVVGFSRVAIIAHYPSDIIGGWMWVGAWLTLFLPVDDRTECTRRGRPTDQD